MFRVTTSQRIKKYILLCLLCFDSVFSATIATVQRLEDDDYGDIYSDGDIYSKDDDDGDIYSKYDDDGDIYSKDVNILLYDDFFRFTTRKRYIWEDWTVPTSDYKSGRESSEPVILLYVVIPILVLGFVIVYTYLCIKKVQSGDCCSSESDSDSSNLFTTVHRPPERRRDLTAQVHRPTTGRNQYANSRRELLGEPVRSDELDNNRGRTDTASVTISFVNFSSAAQSRTEPDNTVSEKPPDYSTVTMSDLVNPTTPAFPVVKTDNETPPPEYGIENPLFK